MNEGGLEYPGIGRLHYFLAHLAMIAAVVFVVTVFGPDSPVMNIITVVVMVAGLVLDVMRLRNIGASQWFVFLRYVPFGSTVLAMALLCAQTGWAETRRLDSAGRSILLVEILWIALMLFLIFRKGIEIFPMLDNGISF
jgi:uncharacterized membrane protein YhaH (DUF805 family)